MGKIVLFLSIFLLACCGIPEFIDINTPVKNETLSSDGTIAAVNISSSPETTKYSLYGRFYISPNKKYFEDLELDEVTMGSEKYLTDLGYKLLDIEKGGLLYNTIIMNSDTTLIISNPPFKLDINGTQHPLKYKYTISGEDKYHSIGNFTDADGLDFKKWYEDNVLHGTMPSTIQIEFAVIAKGLNPATVTSIESVPVHIGYLDLQTQG